MMIYSLYTLVDITHTKQNHGAACIEKSQQQNFNTVLQTIGLSGNVYFTNDPVRVPATKFKIKDKECWYFEWKMEISELFTKDGDPIAILKENFEFVPFIAGLTEQVKLDPPYFKLNHNIVFDYKQ